MHPRDGDLIVATHGRGVWIADDVTPLQQLTASVRAQDAYLFDMRPAVAYSAICRRTAVGPPCRVWGRVLSSPKMRRAGRRSTTTSKRP